MLTQKTILITGGATGIGLELARLLVAQNNTVLICGRRREKLEEAVAAIPELIAYICDVGDALQCQSMAAAIKEDGYTLNVLVNNAAVLTYDDFNQLDMQQVRDVINGNFLGPIELVNLFLADLKLNPTNRVINIDSPAGRCPMTPMPIYAASKSALDFYTRSLRTQMKGKFLVVEVFPPTVATTMTDEIKPALLGKMSAADCAKSLLRQVEAGKQNIWIGVDAKVFRFLELFFPPFIEKIINSPIGVQRK